MHRWEARRLFVTSLVVHQCSVHGLLADILIHLCEQVSVQVHQGGTTTAAHTTSFSQKFDLSACKKLQAKVGDKIDDKW